MGSDEFQVLFVLVDKMQCLEREFQCLAADIARRYFFLNDTQRFCRDRDITKTKRKEKGRDFFFVLKYITLDLNIIEQSI